MSIIKLSPFSEPGGENTSSVHFSRKEGEGTFPPRVPWDAVLELWSHYFLWELFVLNLKPGPILYIEKIVNMGRTDDHSKRRSKLYKFSIPVILLLQVLYINLKLCKSK